MKKSHKFLVPVALLASGILSAYAKQAPEGTDLAVPYASYVDDHALNLIGTTENVAIHSDGEVFDFVLKRAETGPVMAYHRSHRSHSSHRSGY